MIVYKIQNKINGKIYIGMTKNSLEERVSNHLENKSIIGQALRKYGLQSFDVSIIDVAKNREVLADKEMYWICFYDCKAPNGYNLTDGGDGIIDPSEEIKRNITKAMTGRKASVETKEKMSSSHKKRFENNPELKEISRNSGYKNRGKVRSEETKKKIGDAQRGRINGPQSEETKDKISKALKGRPGKKGGNSGSFKKGVSSWNVGVPMSEEAKKKSSKSHAGKKNPEHSKRMKGKYSGEKHPMYGKHHTEESNRKNRVSNIGKNSARYGKPAWNSGLTKETDERVNRMYNKEGATLQ